MAGSDGASHQFGSVPLFAGLPSDVLDRLAAAAHVRSYPRGQILASEGDPGDFLIVLESGQLRVSRYTPMGVEAVLAVVEAPAALGELALLDGSPRDATITAQHPVTVRLLPRSVFQELLRQEPRAVDGLLTTLAGLVRAGNSRHADFVGLDVPARLARWLLRRTGDDGPTVGAVVTITQSQSDLASELGTTRSTINRALHDFENQGIVSLSGNDVTLRKPQRLLDLLS